MNEPEAWCGRADEHGGHWGFQFLRCDGVSKEEAAVMGVLVENGNARAGSLDRDDARRVIAALDAARGES